MPVLRTLFRTRRTFKVKYYHVYRIGFIIHDIQVLTSKWDWMLSEEERIHYANIIRTIFSELFLELWAVGKIPPRQQWQRHWFKEVCTYNRWNSKNEYNSLQRNVILVRVQSATTPSPPSNIFLTFHLLFLIQSKRSCDGNSAQIITLDQWSLCTNDTWTRYGQLNEMICLSSGSKQTEPF